MMALIPFLINEPAIVCEVFDDVLFSYRKALRVKEVSFTNSKGTFCLYTSERRVSSFINTNRRSQVFEYDVVTAWHSFIFI